MKREKLEEIYDALYLIADDIINTHNPCEINKDGCLCGNFCCSGCKYLGENGCTVKCLACKTHLCRALLAKNSNHLDAKWLLNYIRELSRHYNLDWSRLTKKDCIDRCSKLDH